MSPARRFPAPCFHARGVSQVCSGAYIPVPLMKTRARILKRRYVIRLRSFLALGNFKLYPLAFVQRAVAVADDRTEMNKHVGAVFLLDKTIAFIGIEPLNCSCCSRHI